MSTKAFLAALLLLSISCKSQTTYSAKQLAKQSEKINNYFSKNKTANKSTESTITFGDIIKQLDVQPITFYFDTTTGKIDEINVITLVFNNAQDASYMDKNNLKPHGVKITLKNVIKWKEVAEVYLSNKKVWTDDVNNYFKNMPIESFKSY